MPHKHLVLVGAVLATAVIAAFGAAAAPAHARHPSALRFYGFGSRYLPPFQVATPSTMIWKNSGEVFQTFSKGVDGANVNSAARNGATYLAPGSYRLNVNAIGTWTIRIVPGAERPKPLGNGLVGFTGSGGRDLPPFATRSGVQLHWKNTGSIFQILNDSYSGGGSVNSHSHRGDTFLNAGTHLLSVNAIGTWVVSWRAPG